MTEVLVKYIENVPVTDNETFAFHNQNFRYPKFMAGESYIDYADIFAVVFSKSNGKKIDFNAEKWDFSESVETANPSQLKINFRGYSDSIVLMLKFFAIYQLSFKNKISSTCQNVSNVLRCLDLQDDLLDIEYLDIDDVYGKVIESRKTDVYKRSLLTAFYLFLIFVRDNYDITFDNYNFPKLKVDIATLSLDAVKYPLIDWELYNKMMNTALEISYDESRSCDLRILASILVIHMQTGLRTSDVLILKNDDLIQTSAPDNQIMYSMKYKETKTSEKDFERIIECDISKEAGEAFLNIIALKNEEGIQNPYLFAFKSGQKPIDSMDYNRAYSTYMYNYMNEECFKPYENSVFRKLRVLGGKYGNGAYQYMCIPSLHSFRVNVCTFLSESGCYPKAYIRNRLGHLSSTMDGYYNRPKDKTPDLTAQENRLIDAMLKEDIAPLGGRNDGTKLKENMKRFIEENYEGLDNIIDIPSAELLKTFEGTLKIRSLSGGYCIKDGDDSTPCTFDGRKNDIPCAFNSCINQYYFYFNLPETYQNYLTACKFYTLAVKLSRAQEMTKEAGNIKFWCERINGQMRQLQSVIQKKTSEVLLEEKPELEKFILEYDSIMEEIGQWL